MANVVRVATVVTKMEAVAHKKRARTVSRLRIFYIIMMKGNSSELPFLYIESQQRHLTAYDALILI
jgi:hypothetical protein